MNSNVSQLIPDMEPRASRIPNVEPRASRSPDVEPRASSAANGDAFAPTSRPDPFYSPVVIRMATARDQRLLERLAQLDSAQAPASPTLIGEVQGQAVVAVSLLDGQAIADPFVAVRPILELVRLRAGQLRPKARSAPGWSSRRRY